MYICSGDFDFKNGAIWSQKLSIIKTFANIGILSLIVLTQRVDLFRYKL
jgi:hypothetical protein